MNILVLGHSGFLGHKFLEFLNHNYKGIFIAGISDDITGYAPCQYPNFCDRNNAWGHIEMGFRDGFHEGAILRLRLH